ncbi:MAG: hypothetical protein JSR66_18395 [Proteobacteria bacterium]|nr:hypothetical protein [Pseudomonadota bacterium]
MAVRLSHENEVQPFAPRGGRITVLLVAMALGGLAMPSLARDGGRDSIAAQARSGSGQSVPMRSGVPRPPMTRGAVSPQPYPARTEYRFSGGHRVLETTQAVPGRGTYHAVRYGNALTGVVEHPLKSGYLNRTYVQGGRVLYARVYRRNTFQRFGHAFHYETLVPAIAFGTAYYAWAVRPWSAPVRYRWQWDGEPWHRAYGGDFTPYSSYTSLDEWLTDYVVAQNYRNAYDNWQAENAPANQTVAAAGSASSNSFTAEGPRPYWDTPDDGRRPYWEEQPAAQDSSGAQHASGSSKPHSGSSKAHSTGSPPPSAQDSPPPLSGPMKAEVNAQIKRQLTERQAPAMATAATADLPESLKPGHTLFRVSTPLDVPAKVPGQLCSLRTNDYIERTGDMDQNGMVPVKVKVGGATDCTIGLMTQVSVNDLEAMESEQQQALTDALVAASSNMGKPRGLPQAPATTPLLLAAGQTHPAADAPKTLGQLQ